MMGYRSHARIRISVVRATRSIAKVVGSIPVANAEARILFCFSRLLCWLDLIAVDVVKCRQLGPRASRDTEGRLWMDGARHVMQMTRCYCLHLDGSPRKAMNRRWLSHSYIPCFVLFRKVKTLYPCVAENSSELSFEAGVIITNGKLDVLGGQDGSEDGFLLLPTV